MTMQVKLETFLREAPIELGVETHGVRICFLYSDRGPDIFEKDGFANDAIALQWGKNMVADFVKSCPGATAQEEPCTSK